MAEELQEYLPVIGATVGVIVGLNITLSIAKGGFKRDAVKSSFSNPLIALSSLLSNKDSVLESGGVQESIDGYENLFDGARKDIGACTNEESIKKREKEYQTMVNSFYNLVTDFYEYGWGQSFHFAPRKKWESFEDSICRAEYYLALRTGLTSGMKALDVGCGVGGPMRNIHQFSGADITGVTINDYQVKVANQYCAQKGFADKTRVVQGDFQKLSEKFEKESFDAAYAVEATCHSPNRVQTFKQINHCLKPGGMVAILDWVVLPERGYDANNKEHVRVKEGIEVGNGLPTLATSDEIYKAFEEAGFEVVDHFDLNQNVHSEHEIAWYQTLKGEMTLKGFRMTHVGRICTHFLVNILEAIRIAPKGTVQVSALLNATALDLVEAGEKELFTPSYFYLARKK